MANLLLVPHNDWIHAPIPSRLHFIFTRLATNYKHKISVLLYPKQYLKLPKKLKQTSFASNITFHHYRTIAINDLSLYYLLNSEKIFMKLQNIINNEKIDIIVHSNILPSAIVVTLAKKRKIPTIFDYIDHFPQSAESYYKNKIIQKSVSTIVQIITKYNIKNSSLIVAVSDYLNKIIKKMSPEKPVITIPNGVDLNHFKPMDKQEVAHMLGLTELINKKVLIYVGTLAPWLNFEALFKSIKKLIIHHKNLYLLIVGGSLNTSYIKYLKFTVKKYGIEKFVKFTGYVPYSIVPYYINLADVAVHPAKEIILNETTPLKLLEYLACGKPVLVTDIMEIKRRFKEYIITYEDSNDFRRKLLHTLYNFNENPTRIRETIHEYSWDNIAARYNQIITHCLQ